MLGTLMPDARLMVSLYQKHVSVCIGVVIKKLQPLPYTTPPYTTPTTPHTTHHHPPPHTTPTHHPPPHTTTHHPPHHLHEQATCTTTTCHLIDIVIAPALVHVNSLSYDAVGFQHSCIWLHNIHQLHGIHHTPPVAATHHTPPCTIHHLTPPPHFF